MSLDRDYEVHREGEAFVTGNPWPADLINPEVDNDTRATGLSAEQGESGEVLLSDDATAEFDGDFPDAGRANLDRVDDEDDLETRVT